MQRLIYILQNVCFCGHFGLTHFRIILLGLFKNSGWNYSKVIGPSKSWHTHRWYFITLCYCYVHTKDSPWQIDTLNWRSKWRGFFAHFFILTRHFLTSLTKKIGLHYQGKINFCRQKKRLKSNFVRYTSTSVYHRHLICHEDHLKLFSLNNEYALWGKLNLTKREERQFKLSPTVYFLYLLSLKLLAT